MPLYRDLKPGDSIYIGDTLVTLEAKSGGKARLRIDGPERGGKAPPPAEKPAPNPKPAAAVGRAPFLRSPEDITQ